MLLVGIPNHTATMENILVVFYNAKYSLTMCSGSSIPVYLSELKTYGNTKTYL